MATKTCKRCKETKPVSDFYKKKDNKDGLQSACKPCQHSQRNVNAKKVAAAKPVELCKEGETPDHMKKEVYTTVIKRLESLGLMSKEYAREALERVSVY